MLRRSISIADDWLRKRFPSKLVYFTAKTVKRMSPVVVGVVTNKLIAAKNMLLQNEATAALIKILGAQICRRAFLFVGLFFLK